LLRAHPSTKLHGRGRPAAHPEPEIEIQHPTKESTMPYVDGFVVPVPKDKIEAYRTMAETAGAVWREHGALEFHECIADDVKPGELTSFPQAVQLKDDETVFFSWIVYNSREERDAINEKVMNDPRLKDTMSPESMPFDGKRMFWGGFQTFVSL
jgi:uncharacterized protein YbaA (DUF1428 family)